jgi:cell division transport system permease protein
VPDHLKELFDRALEDEPVPPDDGIAQLAMAQGRGLRRRRGLLIGGSAAAAVLAVVAALNLATPAQPETTVQLSAAAAALAQAEPQCGWKVAGDATDVAIFLSEDATAQQRDAVEDALRADPLVRSITFQTRETAYEKFKQLWADSPEFVEAVSPASMPESFRLELTEPERYAELSGKYAGRAGVSQVIGGTCP